MKAHITFVYPELTPNRHVDLAVCVLALKRHGYPVVLHTNLEHALDHEIVTRCEIIKNRTPRTGLWTSEKFATFAQAHEDDGVFLHVDCDAFVLRPLPQWLLSAPIFVQTDLEPQEWYGDLTLLSPEWRSEFLPAVWRAMNMGIFGGDPNLVRDYAYFALRSTEGCAKHPRGHVLSEQATLGRYCEAHDIRVASLTQGQLHALPMGYRHLMSKKDDPAVRREVEGYLRELDYNAAKNLLDCPRPRSYLSHRIDAGDVLRFYKDRTPRGIKPATGLDSASLTLTAAAGGLGDCVVLTDIERTARSHGNVAWAFNGSPHWEELVKHCPCHVDRKLPWAYDLLHAVWHQGLGAGHIIQRAQRLFGYPVHPAPSGHIVPEGQVRPLAGRVCLHLEPSPAWSRRQQETQHPRARRLSSRDVQLLISVLRKEGYRVIEVGKTRQTQDPDVEDGTGLSLTQTIRLMAECEFFVGIDSGPMHLATALGLKVICLVNHLSPDQVFPPVLVPTVLGEEWLYPQNVHLHLEDASVHWPRLHENSLASALRGEVYPYWNHDILSDLEGELQ